MADGQGVARLFDEVADGYDQNGADFFTPVGRELVGRAGVAPGERVLDLGCGRGAVLFAAAAAAGPDGRVVGLDLAPRMVELTGADAADRGLTTVEVMVGDATDPPLPAGSFDAVLASFFVYFLPDPPSSVARYRALLAPGGRFAFTAFAAQDPVFDAAMRAVGEFVPGGMPDRGARQGPFGAAESIKELLAGAGFADVSITEAIFETTFADADEWLASTLTNGARTTWDRVPEASVEAARAKARDVFEDARTDAGDYVLRHSIRFAVAQG